MSNSNTIKCPNCATIIDIDEIFYHQIEEKFKQKHLQEQKRLELEIEQKRKEYKKHLSALKAKEEALKEQEERFQEELQKATKERIKQERAKLQEELKQELLKEQNEAMEMLKKELEEKSNKIKELHTLNAKVAKLEQEKAEIEAKAKAELQKELSQKLQLEQARIKEQMQKEQNEAIALLKEELEAKSKQLAELNKAKIEIEQLKREKEEMVLKAKMEAELELTKRLNEEKLKLKQSLDEEIALKLKAKDEQIEQMKRDIEAAKRKAEQGSQQIQGEALELTIESWLKSKFPFDSIEEVKKGAFGADCIQRVHTREMQNCGVICYESKNTKAWSDAWITKLKQDMLKVNADIGVLVTSVYPNGMDRMGFVDGIWVCSLDEFKGSVFLLRESLIRVAKTIKKEENRGDKMALLYNYLTGNEFQMQLKAIVDGFMAMQSELDKERRSLMAAWKRRQKIIDGVLENTTQMYGALQGIAGNGAIAHIDALELPEEFEE